jgi:hypothetical protein
MTAETVIQNLQRFVIASEAKQSIVPRKERMDCFVATLLAMTSGNTSGLERPL